LEFVGNFCLVDGKMTVIEYSDLPDRLGKKHNPDGSPAFRLGAIDVVREEDAGAERDQIIEAVPEVLEIKQALYEKLAALARITVKDAALEKFTREFDAILAYVGQLERLEIKENVQDGGNVGNGALGSGTLRNVMREDGEPHAPGTYTEKLVAQFPASENNALVVKQIIKHD